MSRFFSSGAIEFGPWSPSKAGVLALCPLKFIFQYVEKPKLAQEDKTESDDSALVMGTAVHKYAENLVKGLGATEAASNAFKDIPTTRRNNLVIRTQKRGIDGFAERMTKFRSANLIKLDKAELRLSVDGDLKSVDFWDRSSTLRGVLDRVLILDKNGQQHAIAIDIKTGRPRQIEEYKLQLESYGVLLHSAYDLETVSMAVYFSSSGELIWYPRKVTKKDISEDNPVFTTINSLIATIDPSKFSVGRHCNWCDYKILCERERDSL